jgi:hypothetical protein
MGNSNRWRRGEPVGIKISSVTAFYLGPRRKGCALPWEKPIHPETRLESISPETSIPPFLMVVAGDDVRAEPAMSVIFNGIEKKEFGYGVP